MRVSSLSSANAREVLRALTVLPAAPKPICRKLSLSSLRTQTLTGPSIIDLDLHENTAIQGGMNVAVATAADDVGVTNLLEALEALNDKNVRGVRKKEEGVARQ